METCLPALVILFSARQVDELLLGVDAALGEDVAGVGVHGVERDHQLVADVGAAAAGEQQLGDLGLARGEAEFLLERAPCCG